MSRGSSPEALEVKDLTVTDVRPMESPHATDEAEESTEETKVVLGAEEYEDMEDALPSVRAAVLGKGVKPTAGGRSSSGQDGDVGQDDSAQGAEGRCVNLEDGGEEESFEDEEASSTPVARGSEETQPDALPIP